MVRGHRHVGLELRNGVVQDAVFTADGYAGLDRFERPVDLHLAAGQRAPVHRYQYEYHPAGNLVTDGSPDHQHDA
jgi:YD repeat-containing protein